MTLNLAIYFSCVLTGLLAFSFGLIFLARKTKWKPEPIRPIFAALILCSVVFLAGLVCSFFGKDIHILYWWLLGLPIAAVFFPLLFVCTGICVRLINRVVGLLLVKLLGKK